MADLSVFDKIRSVNDFARAQEEWDMKKQLAQAQLQKQAMGGDLPSSIQEWNAYNSMSPQDQQRYLQMKRSDQIMNLGGTMAVRNPMGGIQESYQVTPKMTDMPEFQGMQEMARKQAAGQAELGLGAQKNVSKANSIISTIDAAKSLLPVASGGYGGALWSAAKSAFNVSDATTQANERLKQLSGWLVANVPRMEGPQSNFDVQNYQIMAGDIGNTTKSIGDRIAALEGLLKLQEKYASQNQDILNQSQDPMQMWLNAAQQSGQDNPYSNIPQMMENSPALNMPNALKNTQKMKMDSASKAETVFNAKKAIRNGADADLVRQRLIENGIDPTEAGL